MKLWHTLCILFLLVSASANAAQEKNDCPCDAVAAGHPKPRCLTHYKKNCRAELTAYDKVRAAQSIAEDKIEEADAARLKSASKQAPLPMSALKKICSCSTIKDCREPSSNDVCYPYYAARCAAKVDACIVEDNDVWGAYVQKCRISCKTSRNVQLYNADCPVCAKDAPADALCLPTSEDAKICKQFYSLQNCQAECGERHGIPVVSTYWSCLQEQQQKPFKTVADFSSCVNRKF